MSAAPEPSASQPTHLTDELLARELPELQERRRRVQPSLPDDAATVRSHLVGLALSGGGIRSASFNLGLLQALCAFGLLRHVDYLSTVSGGGYIGSFLSTLLADPKAKMCQDNPVLRCHLLGTSSGAQPNRVRDFVRGGQYLNHPVVFSNRYLMGLIFNNVALFSGLLAVCVAIAWLWRWLLDEDEHARFLHLGSGGLILEWHRPFLPAILVFSVWLLVWCGYLLARVFFRVTYPRTLTQVLLLLAFACFLIGGTVFLATPNPSIIGTTPGAGKQAPVLAGAVDTQSPGQHLTISLPHEYLAPLLLLLLLLALVPFLRPKDLIRSGVAPQNKFQSWVFGITSFALLIGVPLAVVYWFARHDFGGYYAHRTDENGAGAGIDMSEIDVRRWNHFWGQIVREAEAPESSHSQGKYLWSRLDEKARASIRNRDFQKEVALWSFPKDQNVKDRKKHVLEQLNECLKTSDFTKNAIEDMDAHPTTKAVIEHQPAWTKASSMLERWHRGGLDEREQLQLNRYLLEASYPYAIWPQVTIRRPMAMALDQQRRACWFFGCLGIYVIAGLLVNFNRTSAQGYYRERLAEAYFHEHVPGTVFDPPLSELDTASRGGPYHLLTGTLNFLPNVWRLVSGKRPHRRNTTAGFLFSRLWCGSEETGYLPTSDYHRGRLQLSDAMAISGAAFTPFQATNPLLSLLLLVLNMRLGHWLPYPRQGSTGWLSWFWKRPTTLSLLADSVWDPRESHFAFLSDGGHHENLGVEPLLQRRCRLIISSDAGCDHGHDFADLLRLERLSRLLNHGQLHGPAPNRGGLPLHLVQPHGEHNPRSAYPPHPRDVRLCPRHLIIGRIEYPDFDNSKQPEYGYFVYLKPSLTGDEANDLLGYAAAYPEFPHDPTPDQLYGIDRYESYRQLGFHIGKRLCEALQAPTLTGPPDMWDPKFDLWERLDAWIARENAEGTMPGS